MTTHFEKFIEYFKNNPKYEDSEQLLLTELLYKELFFSKVTNDRKIYGHVRSLMVYHGLLSMFSRDKFIINLVRIRNFDETKSV